MSLSTGTWIKVGKNQNIDAYVFRVDSDTEIFAGYYQNGAKAIGEDFVWNGAFWDFKYSTPSGSYLRGERERLVKKGPYV